MAAIRVSKSKTLWYAYNEFPQGSLGQDIYYSWPISMPDVPNYRKIDSEPPDYYQALPKVELHRHLEGSLRISTLIEVARSHGLDITGTGQLRSKVQVQEGEPFTFQNFLSKFGTLRTFYRTPEIIGRIAYEAVEDAAADNIRHLELRFTPMALSVAQGFSLAEVTDWVIEYTRQADQKFGITTSLIASINRHESLQIASEVVQLAVDRKDRGLVGIDLAGNDAEFSAKPFVKLFKEAKRAGIFISIHAGEWGGPGNVAEAIQEFNTDRIGHGVRVMEDPQLAALARDYGCAFEVCVTSNHQSGVVQDLSSHPLPGMLLAGINATINTDDPSISQIRLSDEYRLVCEYLGLSRDALMDRILAAARASFLTPEGRQLLVDSLQKEFNKS